MSLISLGMNLLLGGLLVAAMVVGLRLNKRLRALKDSHEGFEAAVVQLNMAAHRAEQGLADLRAATDEATDLLSDRIEKGRELAAKLERLISSAPELPRAMAGGERPAARGIPSVSPPLKAEAASEDRLGALLAMARSRLEQKEAAQRAAMVDRLEKVAPRQREPEPELREIAPREVRAAPPPPQQAAAPSRPAPRNGELLVSRAAALGRRMPTVDDDLFEDLPPLTLDRELRDRDLGARR